MIQLLLLLMAILTSPSTLYQAGVGPLATLFDAIYPVPENGFLPGLGLMRRSPYFDPIFPGTPKDSWGVSAGAQAGFVNPAQGFPSVNIVAVSPAAPGVPQGVAGTAPLTSVTRLRVGISDLLEVTHLFDWVAGTANENIIQVAVSIRNMSGAAQTVRYRRAVDWDVAAIVLLQERTNFPTVSTFPSPLVGVARGGLGTSPNPLTPLVLPVTPAGGDFGPADQGHAFDVDFGTVPDGGTVQTTLYYAVAAAGGSQAALRAQLEALLACEYVATSYSSADAQLAAALAIAVPCVTAPCCPCGGGTCCQGVVIPEITYLTYTVVGHPTGCVWADCLHGFTVGLIFAPELSGWVSGAIPLSCPELEALTGCRVDLHARIVCEPTPLQPHRFFLFTDLQGTTPLGQCHPCWPFDLGRPLTIDGVSGTSQCSPLRIDFDLLADGDPGTPCGPGTCEQRFLIRWSL